MFTELLRCSAAAAPYYSAEIIAPLEAGAFCDDIDRDQSGLQQIYRMIYPALHKIFLRCGVKFPPEYSEKSGPVHP